MLDFKKEFCGGSSIDVDLYEAAIDVTDNAHQEVYDLMDRHVGLNGHTVPHNYRDTAIFRQESGEAWMCKPSNPVVFEDGKIQKYLCPTGRSTGAYLPPVTPSLRSRIISGETKESSLLPFWAAVQANVAVPIVITEGGKKGLAGLSMGVATIAVSGVDAWNAEKGSKELHPDLSRFAYGSRVFLIAFDEDSSQATRDRVFKATNRLAKALKKESPDIVVRVVTWASQQGKGLDDFIVKNGVSAFTARLQRSIEHDPLCHVTEKGARNLNPVSKIAETLARDWSGSVVYRQEFGLFMGYKEGRWIELSKEAIGRSIQEELNATRIGYGASIIPGILEALKLSLLVEAWIEAPGIPFKNGVLDLATRKLSPHKPENRLTWQLPSTFTPGSDCPKIKEWLLEAQEGSHDRREVLRAYLRAIVTGASHLQRFLELIGPGGSGKSTFSTLAVALVGRSNVLSTSIQYLENNRFVTAALYGKRLCIIPDADGYNKSVSQFKAITGGDEISYERKNKDLSAPYTYEGMVLYVANQPLASIDTSSGLHRRRCTVPFNKMVRPEDRKNLIHIANDGKITGEFADEISGLMNWVLEMSDEEMTIAVLGIGQYAAALQDAKVKTLTSTNPLSLWVVENTQAVPGSKAIIGVAKVLTVNENGVTTKVIDRHDTDLYPNYVTFCNDRGLNAISLTRFKSELVGLCREQLGIEGISDLGRIYLDGRRGSAIEGLALAHPNPEEPIDQPEEPIEPEPFINPATKQAEEPVVEYEFEVEYVFTDSSEIEEPIEYTCDGQCLDSLSIPV